MSSLKAKTSYKTEPLQLVEKPSTTPAMGLPEVVIGRITGFDPSGAPLVDFPGNAQGTSFPALVTAPCDRDTEGRDVALLFIQGDRRRPLIVGLIQKPEAEIAELAEQINPVQQRPSEARLDGERVVLSADKEIVLECGKASITLMRAGKVLIRGTYLSSRSTGANRIRGGSVQLN